MGYGVCPWVPICIQIKGTSCKSEVPDCPNYTTVGKDVKVFVGRGGWGNHFERSSPRENPPPEAEKGSQSGGHRSVEIWHPLMNATVSRVASTVSTACVASNNMKEGSPHEDGSPGQGHSQRQHSWLGVPDPGITGDSRAGHVSDSHFWARICRIKGPYPGGTVVWWIHIL